MLYQLIWNNKLRSRKDVQIDALIKEFNVYCPRLEKYKDFKNVLVLSYVPFTNVLQSFMKRYEIKRIEDTYPYYSTHIPIGLAYSRKSNGYKFTIEGFLIDGYI